MIFREEILKQKGSLIRAMQQKAKPDSINLAIGMPYCTTPEVIKKYAIESITNNKTYYSSNYGVNDLRDAIAIHYNKKHKNPITSKNVLVTVGVAEAIFISLFAIINPDDEVIIPDPGYPGYFITLEMLSSKILSYPLFLSNNFSFRANDIIEKVSENTRAIILNSPSNPTGGINSTQELQKLSEFCKNKNICIISDEVYSNLNYSNSKIDSISNYLNLDKCFILDGVSKEFSMTGWRIGWIISSEQNINNLVKIHQVVTSCASTISQYASLRALTSETNEIVLALGENKKLMQKKLSEIKKIKYYAPDSGLYFFVDFSQYGNDILLADKILENANVITVPGSAFGKNGKGFLRLSFGAEPEKIIIGIDKIKKYLETI